MKKLLLIPALLGVFACSSTSSSEDDPVVPPPHKGDTDTTVVYEPKPKAMWIDAEHNFTRLSTKEKVTENLQLIKDAGMDIIYLDVKPGMGKALYKSDILEPLTAFGTTTVERDWDYLDYFLTECDRLGLKCIASISAMGYGYGKASQGPIYESNDWDGKTQVKMVDKNPNNLVDIKDDLTMDAAMLNPCLPEVQQFVISICTEIVRKYGNYPAFKGLSLDYLRWSNSDSDGNMYGFGDATMTQFQNQMSLKIDSRNDIITASGGMGKYFKEWIYFRTQCVSNLLRSIKTAVKNVNPNCELHLWASADWASRYSVGQNWASDTYVPSGGQYYSDYSTTGFAKDLDCFVLGAYANYVYKSENPGSIWSVENFVTTYKTWIPNGECDVWGSLPAYAYDETQIANATALCLKYTDGLMIFELGHVINRNLWDGIKKGITKSGY